jgi:hypothetical protein
MNVFHVFQIIPAKAGNITTYARGCVHFAVDIRALQISTAWGHWPRRSYVHCSYSDSMGLNTYPVLLSMRKTSNTWMNRFNFYIALQWGPHSLNFAYSVHQCNTRLTKIWVSRNPTRLVISEMSASNNSGIWSPAELPYVFWSGLTVTDNDIVSLCTLVVH